MVGPCTLVIHGTKEAPEHMRHGARVYNSYESYGDSHVLNELYDETPEADDVEVDTVRPTEDEIQNILELLAQPKQKQNKHHNVLNDVNPTILAEVEKELLRIHHRMTKYSNDF